MPKIDKSTVARVGQRTRLGVVCISLMSLGIGLNSGDAMASSREETIIVGAGGAVNTLDPLRSDYAQTNIILSAIYDTLVTFHGKAMAPNLATEYAYAPDARSISFTLRGDVKFHDGRTLTAKDVAYTLDRLKRLGTGAASLIDGYESTTITDDTHFTVNLTKPSAVFLPALSKIYILNADLVEQNKASDDGQAWLQSHEAGSGPYTLEDQSQGVAINLFPQYWLPEQGRPKTIVFRRIDESATRRDELLAGGIDVALSLSDRDALSLNTDPNVKVVPMNTGIQTEIVFNTSVGPTADPKVRKALRLVYDYAGGLRGIRGKNGAIANGPLPASLDCRPNLPPVKQDLEAAKAILADAGATGTKFQMSFQPAFEIQKQEATLFQSNLQEIGIDLELVPIAFPNYLASLRDKKTIPQMMLLEDFPQFPDPGIMLVKGYKTDAIGTNRAGYSNPEVDKLLDQAMATGDSEKRCDLYSKVQTILDGDSVMIDMYGVYKPSAYRLGTLEDLKGSLLVSQTAPADFRLAKP